MILYNILMASHIKNKSERLETIFTVKKLHTWAETKARMVLSETQK